MWFAWHSAVTKTSHISYKNVVVKTIDFNGVTHAYLCVYSKDNANHNKMYDWIQNDIFSPTLHNNLILIIIFPRSISTSRKQLSVRDGTFVPFILPKGQYMFGLLK